MEEFWECVIRGDISLKHNSLPRLTPIPRTLRSRVWCYVTDSEKIINTPWAASMWERLDEESEKYADVSGLNKQLQKDLRRTIPSAESSHIATVIRTYVFTQPQIGYVQGMTFFAAVLLNVLDPFQSFWVFTELMNRYRFDALFTIGTPMLMVLINSIDELLVRVDSVLHKYIMEVGVEISTFVTRWICTLWAAVLPLESLLHVWDVILLKGLPFCEYLVAGYLVLCRENIINKSYEYIMQEIHNLITKIPVEEAISWALREMGV